MYIEIKKVDNGYMVYFENGELIKVETDKYKAKLLVWYYMQDNLK